MATPTTLYEYYTQKGQKFPTWKERAPIYEQFGLGSAGSYIGSAEQNVALLAALMKQDQPKEQPQEQPQVPAGQPSPTPITDPSQYYLKPGETIEQYNARIAALRGETTTPKTGYDPQNLTEYQQRYRTDFNQLAFQMQQGAAFKNEIAQITNYVISPTIQQAYIADPHGYREKLIEQLVNKYGNKVSRENISTLVYKGLPDITHQFYGVTPTDLEGDIFGGDEFDIETSDEARDKEEGVDEKADAAKQMEDDQDEIKRLTVQQQLQQIREQLGLDPQTGLERPALPTFEDDFAALRSEHGVTAIESQLNTLETQIRDTEASLRQGLYDEEGKLRPMELIGTRQRELRRQAQEGLDVLNRRKATLVDELNTKNTLIANMMKLKQADYNAATNAYNSQFTQAVQLLNLVEGRIAKADQEANRQRDDARANLVVLQNLLKDTKWSEVDANMRTQLNQLEMKAGLPVGVTEAFMKANPGLKVDYTISGTDAEGNQIVSFFSYNNGDPKLIRTITTAGVKTTDARKAADKESAIDRLKIEISYYMDDWKGGGDREAGTREEFAKEMAEEARFKSYLNYQEVLAEVYKLVTDEWLNANKPGKGFLGLF